jgi:hypothetical protein
MLRVTEELTEGLCLSSIERYRARAREAALRHAAGRLQRGDDLTITELAVELGTGDDTCLELLADVVRADAPPLHGDTRLKDLAHAIDVLPKRMATALHLRIVAGADLVVMAHKLGVSEDRAAWLFLVALAWLRRGSRQQRSGASRCNMPAPSCSG